jgi:hypothetical protein
MLPAPSSGTWTPTPGVLAEARSGAAAAMLSDGRVLVAGGDGAAGTALSSAELFSLDGSFTPVAPMTVARSKHVAVALKDGRVLVAGGVGIDGKALSSAEIYDPSSNAWQAALPMVEARSGATATLLADGKVLVAGGANDSAASASLEVFDPVSDGFVPGGMMSWPRQNHAAALLASGQVLLAGGSDGAGPLASSELWDSASGMVSPGPALSVARAGLSATTLVDGTVLLAGGNDGTNDLAVTEIFDPAAGTVVAGASLLSSARRDHLAVLLPHNSSVLVVGGTTGSAVVSTAELYLPWAGGSNPTGSPSTARALAVASPTGTDGLLLLAGGYSSTPDSPLPTAEVFGFATLKTDQADYPPGTQVLMSGSGWEPNDTVNLTLHETGIPTPDPDIILTVTADANGNIVENSFYTDPHDLGVRFYLTAVGTRSQAQTTFTDAGNFTYSPSTRSLTIAPGSSGNFSQDVTDPKNNDALTATPVVTGTGGHPLTPSWVTTSPTSLSFAASGSTVTHSWTVTVAVPSGTTPGTYTGNIKAHATGSGATPNDGQGTDLTIIVAGASHFSVTGFPSPVDAGTAHNFTVTARDETNAVVAGYTGTVTFSSSDAGATLPANFTFQAGDNGSHTFSATLFDTTGQQTITATDTVTGITGSQGSINVHAASDTTPPVVTVTFNPNGSNGWFTTSPATGTVSASDASTGGSNISAINCTVDSVATPLTGLTGIGTQSASGSLAVSGDGTHSVSCTATDSATNTSFPQTASVKIDTVVPSGTIDINSGATYTSSTSVTLALTCSDGTSLCAQMAFSDDGTTFGAYAAFAASTPYTLPSGDGPKTVYVKFKDNAGNESGNFSHGITLDTAAPTGTISINSGDAATNSTSVTLTLTCNDTGSGCDLMQFSNDGSSYSVLEAYAASKAWTLTAGDGTKTVYVKFKDKAGNLSGAFTDDILLDTVPPVTTITLTPASPDGGDGWYISSVHVAVAATDTGGSGVAETRCVLDPASAPASFDDLPASCSYTNTSGGADVTSDGHHHFYAASKDNAGNEETLKTETFKIDKTAPTTIATPTPGPNAHGWNKTDVSISLNATDNADGSGVKEISYSSSGAQTIGLTTVSGSSTSFSITAEGETTISFYSKDNAGNVETTKTLTLRIDKTPPTISASANKADNTSYVADTWTNQNVTVHFTCADTGGSGVDTCTADVTVSEEGVTPSVGGQAVDLAGNTASASFGPIKIDKTPPTITITAPPDGVTYLLNQAVPAHYACEDQAALSGLATCAGPVADGANIDTATVGSKNFTVNASDNAGNTATLTHTYKVQYNFIGFLPPVDNFPVLNSLKAGQTVPIKWQLKDANGNLVSALSSMKSLLSAPIACSATLPVDVVSELASPGSTVFRFDGTQFIYNWQTSKPWAGSCRLVGLTLDDGSAIRYAMFTLK